MKPAIELPGRTARRHSATWIAKWDKVPLHSPGVARITDFSWWSWPAVH